MVAVSLAARVQTQWTGFSGHRARVFSDERPVLTDRAVLIDEFVDGLDGVRLTLRAGFRILVKVEVHLRVTPMETLLTDQTTGCNISVLDGFS